MIQDWIIIKKKRGINYIVKGNRIEKYKPWLGDLFSYFYDPIMKSTVFPKKLNADIKKHSEILLRELRDVHNKDILELAAGSGSIVKCLPKDNRYIGMDISPGLLRQAITKFNTAGFINPEFYLVGSENFPFKENSFDICLCNLSINFFPDLNKTLNEVKRVLKKNAIFIGSVPVPERNLKKSKINGTLFSEEEFKTIFEGSGFLFKPIMEENGTIFYFKAIKKP